MWCVVTASTEWPSISFHRSSQSSKRLRSAERIESRSGSRLVTVTTGTPSSSWIASKSRTLNPPTAIPLRNTIRSPSR